MTVDSATPKTAVLLVNLGSPEAPTVSAVRRFLRAFLGDPRVVNIPRPIWWLILNVFILPFRPRKSLHAYQKIWTEGGSPLLVLTQDLTQHLANELSDSGALIDFAMSYSHPTIETKLRELKAAGYAKIIVLPLYPQYSSTTTASVHDSVVNEFKRWKHIPHLTFISDYHQHPAYIAALAESIRAARAEHAGQMLIMSFHGLPKQLTAWGDPYEHQCHATAALLAQSLGLSSSEWKIVFQSRFGKAEWLKPYCVDALMELPSQGITDVDIVCPGFAVDCLETLEEIAMENQEVFMTAGGQHYRYIPALNSASSHIKAMAQLIRAEL